MANKTIETEADIQKGTDFLARQCPVMDQIISKLPEIPLRRTSAGFESLASIIVSQQVSKQSADAIFSRMKKRILPLTPANYLNCGEEAWIEIGLSRPKQRTFFALCEALNQEHLNLEELSNQSAEQAVSALTAVKGIGPWTAEVYLLFAVGHPDIFPAGDLALQIAAADAYEKTDKLSEKQLRKMAESWAPWRGVAARILWSYYSLQKERAVMP